MVVEPAAEFVVREHVPVLNHHAAVAARVGVEVGLPIARVGAADLVGAMQIGQHECLLIRVARRRGAGRELAIRIGSGGDQQSMRRMTIAGVILAAIRTRRP